MSYMVTKSGRTKEIPAHMLRETEEYPMQMTRDKIAGLDADGRIVVDRFDARIAPADTKPFLFGLTLCCNASDKGTEHGAVCRCCYGAEHGNYLWRAPDGSFPGLDPIDTIIERELK